MTKKYFLAATLLVSSVCTPIKSISPQHSIFKQIRTKKIELFTQQYLEFQDMLPEYIEKAQVFEAAQNVIGQTCKQLLDQDIIGEQDFEAVNMFLVQKIGAKKEPNVSEITQEAAEQFPALAPQEAQDIITEICKEYISVIPIFTEFATVSQTVEEYSKKLESTKKELVATGMTREEVETLEQEIVQAITQVLEAGMEPPPVSNPDETTLEEKPA